MKLRSIITAVVLAAAFIVTGGSAQAAQGTPPSTCLYEATYPGAKFCDGATWVIPAPKPAHPKWVKVKRGQTLWRLSVIHRGNGHEWPTVAKLNHIKGTKIYAGQWLRVR